MQFIQNGPDIPEDLLIAHEEEKVVFFCGAGISYPAGLPGFKGLVERIYERIGEPFEQKQELNTEETKNGPVNPLEWEAYRSSRFDVTLDLFERRVIDRRSRLQKAVNESLTPNFENLNATSTHKALITLGTDSSGSLRLVTTNFDRVFEKALFQLGQRTKSYCAPHLPIPKKSRWDGIVYLHGLLPASLEENDFNRLVLTSGDFGLAYLVERWAARFVTEMFKNHTVCFVGYSIEDPVLRYMMDAMAADRSLGESMPTSYVLAGRTKDKSIDEDIRAWKAKGVVPVLYDTESYPNHELLQDTLLAWADTYRDGILGKTAIIREYASKLPTSSTAEDDFVSRLLWAISDPSGVPAKVFAKHEPTPPLKWLDEFAKERYFKSDLGIFGIPTSNDIDDNQAFSLISRPAPILKNKSCSWKPELSPPGYFDSRLYNIFLWMCRYLDNREFLWWVIDHGGRVAYHLAQIIQQNLVQLRKPEEGSSIDEPFTTDGESPKAISTKLTRTIWDIIIHQSMMNYSGIESLYEWKDRVALTGLTTTTRIQLRNMLTPVVKFNRPIRFFMTSEAIPNEPSKIHDLVHWQIELACSPVWDLRQDISGISIGEQELVCLINDLQGQILDALGLMQKLEGADYGIDRSAHDLPSIEEHPQNSRIREWTILIELLRDSWLRLKGTSPEKASMVVNSWLGFPYPTFRRLALFAAKYPDVVANQEWIKWLSGSNRYWLWSLDTQREVMRLLVARAKTLTEYQKQKLEKAILKGPSSDQFDLNADDVDIMAFHQKMVWHRLAKLKQGGIELSPRAEKHLIELSEKLPSGDLPIGERDEFLSWIGPIDDPGFTKHRNLDQAPKDLPELILWLKRPKPEHPFYRSDWVTLCRENIGLVTEALENLALKGEWPIHRWQEALQGWFGQEYTDLAWNRLAPIFEKMPESHLSTLSNSLARILENTDPSNDQHPKLFINLCRKIIRLSPKETTVEIDDPASQAINHPVGILIEALLQRWFTERPKDKSGLPTELRSILTEICDRSQDQYQFGRLVLASRVIAIYRVDVDWCREYLLPLFDWDRSQKEARLVWSGFLRGPRLYLPLISELKEQILSTARHYNELGEWGRMYVILITTIALDLKDAFTSEKLRRAFRQLPIKGLVESAITLRQGLESSEQQKGDYWAFRVKPFLHKIWPKEQDKVDSRIALEMARISAITAESFPEAIELIVPLLKPIDHPHILFDDLVNNRICERFPRDALKLLVPLVDNQIWISKHIDRCLSDMLEGDPTIAQLPEYRRLSDHINRLQ